MLIVITGGTKGIGRAIAEKFANEDFDLAICARTTADLKAAKKELLTLNPLNEILAEKVNMQSKKLSLIHI